MKARLPVLVVDDDQDIRETLREVIQSEGFPVVCAADGEEALALLESGLCPGVVLLDLMMPRMNGWQLLTRVREQPAFVGLPIVALSASGMRASPSGATSFLRKPVELEAILELVFTYCERWGLVRESGYRYVGGGDPEAARATPVPTGTSCARG